MGGISKRSNFGLPVFVEECETPTLLAPFKRCDLYGLNEDDARARLSEYLTPASKPGAAQFPGARKPAPAEEARSIPFPGATCALSNIPIAVPRYFLGRDEAIEAIDAGSGAMRVGWRYRAAWASRRRKDYAGCRLRRASSTRLSGHVVDQGAEPRHDARGSRCARCAPRLGRRGEKEEPALDKVSERLRHEGEGFC